jgi:hypothetical protein
MFLFKGEINTISAAPDTGFAFGIGGAKNNEPIVWVCSFQR